MSPRDSKNVAMVSASSTLKTQGPNAGDTLIPTTNWNGFWLRACTVFTSAGPQEALHSRVRLVLSNSTVGWYPLGKNVKRAQFFHGTYRGQAEAIRPFIKYRGYLKMKWWNAMLFERFSGRSKIALCCSEPIRTRNLPLFRVRRPSDVVPN